ncbi:hypothetical protein HDU91_002040 [Kappamyces sp. JEL0680]|nr:hypothetical protein HDU91_002040 [Kappamyces sp. JEL0680]
MKIGLICGSLRPGSSNRVLLHYIETHYAAVFIPIDRLPLFVPELHTAESTAFQALVSSCDGLVMATPEYAHGIPGAFKNALDWLVDLTTFGGKPIAVVIASGTDGYYCRNALLEILKTMSGRVIHECVTVIQGSRRYTSSGKLTDPAVCASLDACMASLTAAIGHAAEAASVVQPLLSPTTRPVLPHESHLIFSFLFLASRMREDQRPIQVALVNPALTPYWRDWGRPNDVGVVAMDGDLPISCAWVRSGLKLYSDISFPDGFVELAIGTVSRYRGRGIGRTVLLALLDQLRQSRVPGVYLNVRDDNPAVRLYQSIGFKKIAHSRFTNIAGSPSHYFSISL